MPHRSAVAHGQAKTGRRPDSGLLEVGHRLRRSEGSREWHGSTVPGKGGRTTDPPPSVPAHGPGHSRTAVNLCGASVHRVAGSHHDFVHTLPIDSLAPNKLHVVAP